LRFDEKNAQLWRGLAVCNEKLGRIAEAVQAQEHAVALGQAAEDREELERLRKLKPER